MTYSAFHLAPSAELAPHSAQTRAAAIGGCSSSGRKLVAPHEESLTWNGCLASRRPRRDRRSEHRLPSSPPRQRPRSSTRASCSPRTPSGPRRWRSGADPLRRGVQRLRCVLVDGAVPLLEAAFRLLGWASGTAPSTFLSFLLGRNSPRQHRARNCQSDKFNGTRYRLNQAGSRLRGVRHFPL